MEKNGMESLEDKFSESNLILLLQLINAGANVDALLRRGLQYIQIADLIFEAKSREFVVDSDTNLALTPLGLEKIRDGKTLLNIKGNWISPLDEFRIERIAIDEVYIPNWQTMHLIQEFNFKTKLLASSEQSQEW